MDNRNDKKNDNKQVKLNERLTTKDDSLIKIIKDEVKKQEEQDKNKEQTNKSDEND